jgi:uncharacterized protein YcfJ
MNKLHLLCLAILATVLGSAELTAQQKGGVVRGGIKGAMVGGLLGGSSGAQVGRAVGAVAGGVQRANYRANQSAMYAESRARRQYQSTTQYKSVRRSNFRQSQPSVIVSRKVVTRR